MTACKHIRTVRLPGPPCQQPGRAEVGSTAVPDDRQFPKISPHVLVIVLFTLEELHMHRQHSQPLQKCGTPGAHYLQLCGGAPASVAQLLRERAPDVSRRRQHGIRSCDIRCETLSAVQISLSCNRCWQRNTGPPQHVAATSRTPQLIAQLFWLVRKPITFYLNIITSASMSLMTARYGSTASTALHLCAVLLQNLQSTYANSVQQ